MYAKLFVGSLPWGVDNAQLEELFSEHGTVQSARVILDRETGRSRGFGFVEMEVDSVEQVIKATNGMEVSGRAIRVNEAEDRRDSRGGGGGGGGPRRGGGGGGGGGFGRDRERMRGGGNRW